MSWYFAIPLATLLVAITIMLILLIPKRMSWGKRIELDPIGGALILMYACLGLFGPLGERK